MFLEITEAAQQRISKAQTLNPGKLVVYYESRIGCICGNNGIFTLKLTQQEDPELDTTLASSLGDLPIQGWSLDFLDEQLTLNYQKEKNTLVLKGASGLINPNVLITDDTGSSVFLAVR
ncbi:MULTISPECIES: iron-sulfur cluster biosynthesis family protein [Carnobacterium]|uniref:Iron-sulfur cluster biosynthesis family protein n=1 Tax=Carnobacterium antarcticum TaxID=2126436 RepID=A0ABW4NLX4_9LACT|nr:iron-sulfur cluster biosynthesis family protein [Carnobacterium sp. CP1]ALV21932.1 hypothetical protein NY10_1324 [Carnobacterium sp. CP1]